MNKSSKNVHALLIANFSNRTGYAWSNIFRLYNVIARKLYDHDIGPCLSYASISPPITNIDKDISTQAFCYDPINVTYSGVILLLRNIKRLNIKYVYATDLKPYHWSYPLMRLAGVKCIVIHSRVSVANPFPVEPETGIKRIIKSGLTRIRYMNADKVYCVSNFVKHRLAQKHCMPEKNIIRILNGINIAKYSCPTRKAGEVIRIYVGARATIHKGVQILFEAANLLVNHYKISNFVIDYAGDGPYISYLKQFVSEHNLKNYINFLGELSETYAYVCNSDIIVVPSIWGDACPSAVSEALAAGKPLITTRAGGIPEIVGDEDNAIIIEPGDAQVMAKKLDDLIKKPELRMSYGKNARLRAESALDEQDYYFTVISQIESDFRLLSRTDHRRFSR